MAATKLEIVNRALAKLGSQRIFINDYDKDTGPIANAVRLVYDSTLEQLVRMHSWQCCKKRNELAPYKLQIEVPAVLTGSGETEYIFLDAQEDATNTTPELYPNYPKWDSGIAYGNDGHLKIYRVVGGGINYKQSHWSLQITVTNRLGTYLSLIHISEPTRPY